MHLGEISFCDKIGFNIKSDETKKLILERIDQLCSFKVIQRHHDRYNDNSLSILTKNPHLVSIRSNGNPYMLFLTKHNFTNQCIFIDKKIQQGYYYPRMIIGKFWFDDALFEDTVIDGEMVKCSDGSWCFIMSDLIVLNGSLLSTLNLVKRMNKLSEILETSYVPDRISTCSIMIKRYFGYHELDHMVKEFIPKLPYSTRGIYFKPLYLKFREILFNFNDELIKKVDRTKLKERHDTFMLKTDVAIKEKAPELPVAPVASSGDETLFYVRKSNQPDLFELYKTNEDNSSHEIACINSLSVSRMMKDLFKECNPNDRILMVCKFHPKFNKWVPIRKAP